MRSITAPTGLMCTSTPLPFTNTCVGSASTSVGCVLAGLCRTHQEVVELHRTLECYSSFRSWHASADVGCSSHLVAPLISFEMPITTPLAITSAAAHCTASILAVSGHLKRRLSCFSRTASAAGLDNPLKPMPIGQMRPGLHCCLYAVTQPLWHLPQRVLLSGWPQFD